MVRRRGSAVWAALLCTVFFAAGCKTSVSQGPEAQAPVRLEEGTEEEAKSLETETKFTEAESELTEESESVEGKATEAGAGEADVTEAGPGAGLPETEKKKDDQEKVEAFAERLQEAVADRDLEGFADLMAYPLTVNMADGESLVIADREALLKQNPDLIFGDDLMMAIANVDTATLVPAKDGVAMGEEGPGLVFKDIGADTFVVVSIQE